ncbi:EpsG family protein [Thermomonas sp. S9]|uniref:EpsG family protein n=1 Tax=Thermomonas sp. S9 TaxID=2885203 RepID=UPI00216B63B2|nr:EpsG family protein [Thermomonas sp. S9]
MNAVPAVLFLIFRKRLAPDRVERKLWVWMALFAIACIPLVSQASTAVDRVALYFIPLQLFVFSRIARLAVAARRKGILVVSVMAYYAAVQLVWLNFATHSQYWIPYRIVWL